MQLDESKRISERLHFEQFLRSQLFLNIPLIAFVFVGIYCLGLEYPVKTFESLRMSIDSLTGLQRETGFASDLPSIVSSILNITEAMYPVYYLANDSSAIANVSAGFLPILLSSIVYHGGGIPISCVDIRLSNETCFDKTYFASEWGSDCATLKDPKLGFIPVGVISDVSSGSWLTPGSSLLAFTQLYYTAYVDMYSLVHSRYEIDESLVYRSDYFIKSFRQVANDDILSLAIQICFGLSIVVLFFELLQFSRVSRHNPMFVHGFWSRCFSLLVALYGVVLFGIKLEVPVDFAKLATDLILSNSTPSSLCPENVHWAALVDSVSFQDLIRILSNSLLVLLVFRVILFFSIHPRLGMLVITLRVGFADFIHFAIVFLVILLWFAFLGTLLFGPHYYYMSTYTRSVFVHFQFLMGSIDFGNIANPFAPVEVWYFVMFGMVMPFAGLYMLLALIVDAYQQYVELMNSSVCGTVLGDLVCVFVTNPVNRVWNGWPSADRMIALLSKPDYASYTGGTLSMHKYYCAAMRKNSR